MVTNTRGVALDSSHTSTSGIDVDISDNFELDRYLGDTLILPYTYQDVKIPSNELGVADNINASFYKLHYNFLYLNSRTKIASNTFPARYKGFVASSKDSSSIDVAWHSSSTYTSSLSHHLSGSPATTGTILSGLVAGAFTKSLGNDNNYVGFVANSGTLMAYQSDKTDTVTSIVLNKKTIEDATSLSFTSIKSMVVNTESHLFVIDDTNIHKFDVEPVLTDNPAISGIGRFLIKTVGGKGTGLYVKDKFGKPIGIATGKDDKVYILDQKHLGYKIYDKDLNWIYTAGRKVHFGTSDAVGLSGGVVVDIEVDKETEYVYVLSNNGAIFEFDADANIVNRYQCEDSLAIGESFKKITLSRKDDNIAYVMTTKSLFKKFKTKLHKSIGAFRLSENGVHGDEELNFVDVLQTDDTGYDYVFLGSNITFTNTEDSAIHTGYTGVHSDVGKVFKFDEKINYKTIVHDFYKESVYSLSAINIFGEEYMTAWIINKALHKLLYNHLLFRDNIHLKFVGQYDSIGRLQYTGVNYITDQDANLFNYSSTLDNLIGLNEPVLAEVINRPLKAMYDLQVELLKMCVEKVTNRFPYPNQVIGLK